MVPDKNQPQLSTGAKQPRLHGADRTGQDLGDLFIRKVVDLAKDNDLTPEIGKFLKGPGQQLTQFSTFDVGIRAMNAGGALDNLIQDIFASSPHRNTPVFPAIDRYAIQPGVELALTTKSPNRRMGLDADVLEEVFRNVSISGQSIQRCEDPVPISSKQERKSLVIAFASAKDERRIRLRGVDSS